MPLQQTSGNVTQDAYGGGVAVAPVYIEDVMSTFLYTGNGSTQTITNEIDLAGKGGMTWFKGRDVGAYGILFDSARGVTKYLLSGLTNAEGTSGAGERLTAYNNNGFSLGTDPGSTINASPYNYASWTFRKQPKFFDVVTYTGTGSVQTISHNLGSAPGCIIVKCTSNGTTNWFVYHSSLAVTSGRPGFMYLDSTSAVQTGDPTVWPSVPTSTTFEVGSYNALNGSGRTYVAYLFAHNAGGFGLTGTDNVISCGSFTTDATTGKATVNLGYEPQFVLTKMADGVSDWTIFDNMRGMSLTNSYELFPNSSSAEVNYGSPDIFPSATGFSVDYVSGSGQFGKNKTIIYIAIRRGPMKVPTDGTKVFAPAAYTGDGTGSRVVTSSVTSDFSFLRTRGTAGAQPIFQSRLQGSGANLNTTSTGAEVNSGTSYTAQFDQQTGIRLGTADTGSGDYNQNSVNFINWVAQRAPGFFDEVCYTGTGAATTQAHNLGVAPELMIIKSRLYSGSNWAVYSGDPNQYLRLNTTNASAGASNTWNYLSPTSTQFSVGNSTLVGASGWTYVAYLFASCPGVSKCTAFTGTGALQTIDCGFTSGARFVLIKRTDSTGDWYVWDSSRGLSSSTDPYLLLNSTAAEVTSTNWVDTTSTGFQVTAASGNNVNINGASYIALAIS